MRTDTRNNIMGVFVLILAIIVAIFCSGCVMKINDVEKIYPDGTKEIDKGFHLGTPDFSSGKEINIIKVM